MTIDFYAHEVTRAEALNALKSSALKFRGFTGGAIAEELIGTIEEDDAALDYMRVFVNARALDRRAPAEVADVFACAMYRAVEGIAEKRAEVYPGMEWPFAAIYNVVKDSAELILN